MWQLQGLSKIPRPVLTGVLLPEKLNSAHDFPGKIYHYKMQVYHCISIVSLSTALLMNELIMDIKGHCTMHITNLQP